jgi:hypothetical protein
MSGVAVAIAGSAILGTVASSDQARKARHAAADAAKTAEIDIDEVDAKTRRIAKQNALDSAELERMLTPEVPELRTAANRAVISGLDGSSSDSYRKILESGLTSTFTTPLLQEAINKARSDLALGGTLSQDVQNAVTRRGLATAGTVGGNLGLGRDIVARDLGLTSMDVERQRLATALQAGEAEQGLATDNATNMLNKIQLLNTINGQRQNYALNAAAFGESIQQPIVGLDPASVANMVSGNASNASAAQSNMANIYGQQGQSYMQLGGQLAGAFLGYKAATAK